MDKLILENVYKNYGEVKAVRGVSFSMKDKEFISIVGPSGCGKSSTLRMIAGLEDITSGSILLDSEKINHIRARDRDVALAFESYALYPHLTVAGNLSFPLEVRGFKGEEITEKVNSILSLLDLEAYMNMTPTELSGGEQQRVALGRALIRGASLYLLDEPFSHLDAQQKIDLRTRVLRIQKLNGLSVILVTHDQLEALAMSDRIVVMNEGEIQQFGTPEELYEEPANLFVADFIGEPPMNFIEGILTRTDGGRHRLNCKEIRFPLPKRGGEKLSSYVDRKIIMGVRPQHISLAAKDMPGAFEGVVFSYEYQGEMGYLSLDCSGERVLIELKHATHYETGARLWCLFDDTHLYLFDPDTGERLL
ncbi:MAG: ABC transporter ATP-binding protein [Spirochaetes bacterium]|nr:ABC transporter ATP-binding protein [Spirochaetota bacterium]